MRTSAKIALLGCGVLVLAGFVLAGGYLAREGCLSIPRDFSTPPARIRIFDQTGAPVSGLETGRYWTDIDADLDGSDRLATDTTGTARFSKIAADIGWFTGLWRKTFCQLAMDSLGSGTHTLMYVRYHGIYDVLPKEKILHPVGLTQQDPDGVWFINSLDCHANTLIVLRFPAKATTIDYALTCKRHAN